MLLLVPVSLKCYLEALNTNKSPPILDSWQYTSHCVEALKAQTHCQLIGEVITPPTIGAVAVSPKHQIKACNTYMVVGESLICAK